MSHIWHTQNLHNNKLTKQLVKSGGRLNWGDIGPDILYKEINWETLNPRNVKEDSSKIISRWTFPKPYRYGTSGKTPELLASACKFSACKLVVGTKSVLSVMSNLLVLKIHHFAAEGLKITKRDDLWWWL